jgi:hypothetical protein
MLITPTVKSKQENTQLNDLKMNVHKYSGLNPESYQSFLNNMDLMESGIQNENIDLASDYLYSAVDNVQDLSLYLTGSSTEITETILNLSRQIGVESEKMIMDVALYKRKQFRPRYLNEVR